MPAPQWRKFRALQGTAEIRRAWQIADALRQRGPFGQLAAAAEPRLACGRRIAGEASARLGSLAGTRAVASISLRLCSRWMAQLLRFSWRRHSRVGLAHRRSVP